MGRLSLGSPQPSAQLLEEEGRAVSGAQEEEGVHHRNVDALVEEVHREDHVDLACGEVGQGRATFVVWGVGPHRDRRDAGLVEDAGHESGVVDADAKAQRAHGSAGFHALIEAGYHLLRPEVVGRELVRKSAHVVAAPSRPGDVAQVEAVVDAVVGEGREVLLVDGVPHAEFGGNPVVEPVKDGEAVAAFGRRRQSKKLHRLHVVENGVVGRSLGVMELVDDHDIEVAWVEVPEASRVQALDRGEDVVEPVRPITAHPQLAKGCVTQGVSERADGLREDLLAMRDEQQA